MSDDSTLDLFKAFVTAITADTYLASQVGNRVFSSWDNQEITTPFIRLSAPMSQQFEMDAGGKGSEVKLQAHIFTTESGPVIARRIASAVRALFEDAVLALDGSFLMSLRYVDTIAVPHGDNPILQIVVVRFVAVTTTQ